MSNLALTNLYYFIIQLEEQIGNGCKINIFVKNFSLTLEARWDINGHRYFVSQEYHIEFLEKSTGIPVAQHFLEAAKLYYDREISS